MPRWFNTAGPCNPADHYMLPAEERLPEPMLAGTALPSVPPDDLRFAIDLGLVRMTAEGGLDVANPIYREIIVRELAFPIRASLPRIKATWLTQDGRLDDVPSGPDAGRAAPEDARGTR
ncbi:hypothetical protein BE21_58280 [Sorangium cellulosum]|uniref:Uncharacterized protein n=1 Tax=Sorangium cellulosum TaxID=56 RepID=A0A150U2J5_SORCE|nr:hypothetical protein BE21_58280 [Sorangium cellulosum]